MNSHGLEAYDALGLAELVRTRQITPLEILEAAIGRIERRNPELNAVVTKTYDAARRQIDQGLPDGPFAGVPYLFKELVVSVEGAATTSASQLYAGNIASADSELVRRVRKAGMVIVGKTNSSEFGLQPVTEPRLYGPTRNPWNLAHSPGGSSGGSAAAVAAGLVPIAHATDGGGSIRIPASCCGLFGLKPTRARITAGPEGGEGLSGLAAQHAVSWSVRDSAALLDATAGPMPGDPYAPASPARPYLESAARDPARLRIAVSDAAPNGAPVDPEVAAAVRAAARLCTELGHSVEEASPRFDVATTEAAFSVIFQANTATNVGRATGGRLPSPDLVEPLTMALAERGMRLGATDYILAVQAMHRESRRIAGFYERYDLWLTPTIASLPPRIGEYSSDVDNVDEWLSRLMRFIPFTWICNLTGQPAMSVPFAISASGLPIGVHFAARYGDEATLFSIAGQIERSRPWRVGSKQA